MPTQAEKKQWREAAEKRLAESEKEKEEEHKRQVLQQHIRGEQMAAEEKAKVKRESLQAWIKAGGSQASFSANWPEFYESLVFNRALKAMTEGKSHIDKSKIRL